MATGHRMFAALWSRQTRGEGAALRRLRQDVAGGVHGKVLEVGFGVGTNWPYLPAGIEYVGIEPDGYMFERAAVASRKQGLALDLRPADVQALPFADATFDSAPCTLTFCSVADPVLGFKELRRVLKPGGELHFAEHVRSTNAIYARLQGWLKPVTRLCGGGCEHDRDTVAAMRSAGLDRIAFRSQRLMGLPVVSGVARSSDPSTTL